MLMQHLHRWVIWRNLKLSTIVLARILRQFCISESYILDLATFCCFFFLAKEANFWFSQFSWANILLICIADTSELNEVDDRPSARCCRWNRSCCCYTSKEINVTFPVRVVCLFSFYYSKVCTFIGSKILIS